MNLFKTNRLIYQEASPDGEAPIISESEAINLRELHEACDALNEQTVQFTIIKGDTLWTRTRDEIKARFPSLGNKAAENISTAIISELARVGNQIYPGFHPSNIMVGDRFKFSFAERGKVQTSYRRVDGVLGEVELSLNPEYSEKMHQDSASQQELLREQIQREMIQLTPEERHLIGEIDKKIWPYLESLGDPVSVRIVSVEDLKQLLTSEEAALWERLLAMDPTLWGIEAEKVEGDPLTPAQIQTVEGSDHAPLTAESKTCYSFMASACREATGESLRLKKAYVSIGYQLAVLNSNLYKYDFNLLETTKHVDWPGYSTHNDPNHIGLTFGSSNESVPFEQTQAYAWLLENGPKYGFNFAVNSSQPTEWQYLSNESGIDPMDRVFLTQAEALSAGLINPHSDGGYIPIPGYEWASDNKNNFAIKKIEQQPLPPELPEPPPEEEPPAPAPPEEEPPAPNPVPDLLPSRIEALEQEHALAVRRVKAAISREEPLYKTRILSVAPKGKESEYFDKYCEDLVISMELAGIPLDIDHLAYVLTSRRLESGFRQRIERNGEQMYQKMKQKYKARIWTLEVALRAKPNIKVKYDQYTTEFRACRYEDEVYDWAQRLANDLESTDPSSLGGMIADDWTIREPLKLLIEAVYEEEITGDPLDFVVEGLRKKPATIGRHQINVDNAIKNTRREIRYIASHPQWSRLVTPEFTIDRDLLVRSLFHHDDSDPKLLPRHVAEGFIMRYYLVPIIESNDINGNGEIDNNELNYMSADFHAGLYASRNAAVQEALNKALKLNPKLVIDGDLSFYTKDGEPDTETPSKSMSALIRYAQTLTPEQLQNRTPEDFAKRFIKLGKSPYMENHPLWDLLIIKGKCQERILPGQAITGGVETEIEGFAVTDTFNYAERCKKSHDVYAGRMKTV